MLKQQKVSRGADSLKCPRRFGFGLSLVFGTLLLLSNVPSLRQLRLSHYCYQCLVFCPNEGWCRSGVGSAKGSRPVRYRAAEAHLAALAVVTAVAEVAAVEDFLNSNTAAEVAALEAEVEVVVVADRSERAFC